MAASDFTNVRVESIAPDQNVLRWSYAGANGQWVYRSTAGGAYSEIAEFLVGYQEDATMQAPSPYYDSEIAEQTSYSYKLSDDDGLTFSDIVTVVSQKAYPPIPIGESYSGSVVSLPVITEVTPNSLQDISNAVSSVVNGPSISKPRICFACPVDGALILDCADGCYTFVVREEDVTDINSISINCNSFAVDFQVPEGTTIQIGGWQEHAGPTGDEGYQAPISGPPGPLNFSAPKPNVGCQSSRYRYPTFSCQDYTRDCFDKGSLIWDTPWNFTLVNCSPAATTGGAGCCSGNETRGGFFGSNALGTVKSGYAVRDRPREGHPLAGYSLLFGNSTQGGLGTAPWECELILECDLSKKVGKPIFGCAINVPETATATNFTGLVFLLDYKNSRVILGQYTNQNLRTEMPAIISNASIPSDVRFFFISNFPSVPYGLFELWDSNFDPTGVSFSNSGYTAPTSTFNVGYGFVWVGNSNPGNHIGYIKSTSSSYIDIASL